MFQEWASEQHAAADTWFDDPDAYYDHQIEVHTRESKRAIPVIQGLLQGDLEPPAAARSLADICENRITKDGDVMIPLGIWKVFCEAVDHFASENQSRERLVLLLVHLSKIDVLDSNGAPIPSDVNKDTFWRQLPGFSLTFRDEMTGVIFPQENQFGRWKRRFHSANAFQAQWLTQVGETGPKREYGSGLNIAIWHLRDGLEVIIEPSPVGLKRTEIYIPGVAPWFFIAGDSLFQLCKANARDDGTLVQDPACWDEGVQGYDYKGKEGFNLERWAHWKNKLLEVSRLQGVKPEVLDAAVKTAAKMEEIEKNA